MAADPGFVHLHVHSAFSLLEGALPIATLAKLAAADGMPALALTDTNNLFGMLEFSEKLWSSGIQPIAGLQLSVEFNDRQGGGLGRPDQARNSRGHVVLLACGERGYENLMRLSSRAFLESPSHEAPHVSITALEEAGDDLIVLTGGPGGPVDRMLAAGARDLAEARLRRLAARFPGCLYVELQRHGLRHERLVEADLVELAYGLELPLVATNEPFFPHGEDHEAHDALLAVAEGRMVSDEERRQLSAEHRFKTRQEMLAQFADLPEALASTVEIARRCHYRPTTRKPILPRFSEEEDEAAVLARQAEAGLAARLAAHGPAPGLTAKAYEERLAFELAVITRMQYPGYFLIVADFISWAKRQGIPVGPGRGSGAGSLVAYALTITDLDPLRFGLLFERFLNPDRVSMPDFDIDFCQDRREEVIRYVQGRYGQDKVAQIITFGTLLARGVLRDVGRVLELPYGLVDKLTKLVPQNPAKPVTLAAAIAEEPRLRAAADDEPGVKRLLAISQKLEGLYRHASTHAAGIVIGDRPLERLVPLYRDPKSDMPVTQYNMKWVEQAGLVKFDFLGLKTLSVLQMACAFLQARGIVVDLGALPLDDAASYALLARAETVGIFQLESGGMRRALADMRPDRFEDIIALVALYRPGPMDNIPVYCAVKHGRQKAEYIHPKLEAPLSETFGVVVYQEQVMEIARLLSGYSLGEADLLRRAMGKKIKAEMDAQHDRFVQGAVERGMTRPDAEAVFEALAKFADYGFNKSHAAAYALVAYQTAYLKANYPVEFMAASMAYELTNTDKLVEFRREAERLGIAVDPPSINHSGVNFEVHGGRIRYALAAVKGVGQEAAAAIVAARGDRPFTSVSDFATRLGSRAVNKRTLETLVAAGAFDQIEPDRARLTAGLDRVMARAQEAESGRVLGQSSLFGDSASVNALALPDVPAWTPSVRLQKEFSAIGFFMSGHPLDEFAPVLERLRVSRFAAFASAVRQGVTVGKLAATVLDRSERRTKTGSRMGVVMLSDPSGQFEATLFAEALLQYRDVLEPGNAVLLTVAANVENDDMRLRIQTAEPLAGAAQRVQKGMRIFLRDTAPLQGISRLMQRRGEGEVILVLMTQEGGEVDIRLPGRHDTGQAVFGAIKAVPGVVAVQPL
jgi:DNA polymerase-3 subunit alpha